MTSSRGVWITGLLTGVASVLVLLALAVLFCLSTGSSSGSDQLVASVPRTPEGRCRSGVHTIPRELVVVDRAVVAPLRNVKRWVLQTNARIEWDSFSPTLSSAPLDESVAVCVLTRQGIDGFEPSGLGRRVQSIVIIVRPHGQSTVFLAGSLGDNMQDTPTSF